MKANKSHTRKASANRKNAPPSKELERNKGEMKERMHEGARSTRESVRRGAEDAGVRDTGRSAKTEDFDEENEDLEEERDDEKDVGRGRTA
jgi:hypothetical protein